MKILLEIKLKENNKTIINQTIQAIKKDNKIKYQENNTINIFNIDTITLERKKAEYKIILDFKTNKCIYIYNNKEIQIPIKTTKISLKSNQCDIKYINIETKIEYEYTIKYKEET